MAAVGFVGGCGVRLGTRSLGLERGGAMAQMVRSGRVGAKVVRVEMSFGGEDTPDARDRFFSILPYFLPLLDSLQYGSYLFKAYPLLRTVLLQPLVPLYSIYRGVPLLDLALFFGVFFLVVRNTNIPRFIRYNAQQAIMLDLILILPGLFSGLGSQVPRAVAETGANTVFYGMMLAVGYAVVENIRGSLPNQIPIVSESVDSQIGPF